MVEELEINHFVLSEEEVASKLLIKVVLSSFFGGCEAGRSELYSGWTLGFIFFNDVAEIIDPDAGHSVIFVKFKVVQLSKGHLSFCWGFVGEVEGLVACWLSLLYSCADINETIFITDGSLPKKIIFENSYKFIDLFALQDGNAADYIKHKYTNKLIHELIIKFRFFYFAEVIALLLFNFSAGLEEEMFEFIITFKNLLEIYFFVEIYHLLN